MMKPVTGLNQLRVGSVGIVEELTLPDEVQHHLMHMGFVPEARVLAVRRAPAGDPTVYSIDGFEIALRSDTARCILISVQSPEPIQQEQRSRGLFGLRKNGSGKLHLSRATG
ncbi:MAG TPA: FeoA family protein [Acidobacteriaceae bacterium]